MTNYSIVKKIGKIINEDDLVIFFGESLCRVAYNFDRDNYFYITNNSINLSFLAGFLFNINKRIFVFCESDFIVRYFNSFVEIRKYFSKNFHIFILRDTKVNNTFNSMGHPQGSFFNIGFKSFQVTPYFETVEDCFKLKKFMETMRDKSVFIVNYDNDVFDKYVTEISKDYSLKKKLRSFEKNMCLNKEG